MPDRLGYILVVLALLGGVTAYFFLKSLPKPLDRTAFDGLYRTPAPRFETSVRVYHIGHSLVGRDMPAMLAQLAGHAYESQLGWGAFLREHWEPDVPLKGGDVENDHPRFREAHDAVGSGEYGALVLTEAVEIRDAIKYFTPHDYVRKWAVKAWEANPDTRVYLYETWHGLDTEEGWLTRLDNDLEQHWEGDILRRALAYDDVSRPIYVVPAGQVMAALVRTLEARGGVGPVETRADLFSDHIHPNDYGAYLVALTHYAVIYGRSPVGLPHDLARADGSAADDLGPELARLMQDTVWDVVTRYPPTGVAAN